MKIGLIDVDGHNFPNLALMKISAWHKARGDTVEWHWGFGHYDRVYMSKVFDEEYSRDIDEPLNADEVIKGGTGYVRRLSPSEVEIFETGKWISVLAEAMPSFLPACLPSAQSVKYQEFLPFEVEHTYPDYSLYQDMTGETAYGFLTRGCPRRCHFCIVAEKEGRRSVKVADLSEWWSGQRNIILMDPNLLACPDHMELLGQLIDSKAYVDVNQGFDCRLLTTEKINAINDLKLKSIHFAWDYMKYSDSVLSGLDLYAKHAKHRPHGSWGTVYTLVNYDTSMEENLYRIYTLRDMEFDPYVMIYDKPNAPQEIRLLQRWCNNRIIFKSVPNFYDYDPRMG